LQNVQRYSQIGAFKYLLLKWIDSTYKRNGYKSGLKLAIPIFLQWLCPQGFTSIHFCKKVIFHKKNKFSIIFPNFASDFE